MHVIEYKNTEKYYTRQREFIDVLQAYIYVQFAHSIYLHAVDYRQVCE